ncbi:hypothetical protein [Nocardioides sp.]|uniref:hypothetical protein n=1 Tax=Nocardioides sp. TaxID=35761 RepID=UPI00351591CA
MTALPDDVRHWRDRLAAGDTEPWEEYGVEFLGEDDTPDVFDTGYLTPAELADPDIAANVSAMAETGALITWVAELDGGSWVGLWRGPDDLPLDRAPVVLLDTEGQFTLALGTTVTEALCDELGWDDERYAEVARACRHAGVPVRARGDLAEPSVTPTPGAFHDRRYRELRGS